ncbi:MAG: peptide-methionine (S)-S-oxide reductase MsrA [Leptotrichiaceae bacterium]|nr:peptide-methionine (S)-S-oxide reductase MsrA [Leptotrichiaceae bacterium]MBP6280624.1 peptide-methionine (S)-S-oxide reductase MsrA [Leptotrichiaceae bacterium]MBP7100109.1 peptide-methionine (S)-S-oxide reductase MsrA [Leptotrichiaceae bacterium]MBP7725123.1 peptide-methionine (S)-S-oxide reductase MsrA [Leptotrichiaceae bacterium]MBP9629194.1 peptide-methionine (S)-S-oxide reductase MsrA [Leptotrichiaceae bacterium]
MESINEIYFAGGCFWGVEAFFKKVPGVLETTVGYANGKTLNTNYKTLKETDHSETVYIKYNKNEIFLEKLLDYYFKIINPTSINKQGNDIGRQYRTGIYYTDENDLGIIKNKINEEQKKYEDEIQVEVEKLDNYILGEEYHQNYLDKNPNGYCHINMKEAIKIIK